MMVGTDDEEKEKKRKDTEIFPAGGGEAIITNQM